MNDDSKKFFEELTNSDDGETARKIVISKSSDESDKEEVEKPKKSAKKEVEIADQDIFDEGEGQLAIDVYQKPDEIIIESAIAGAKEEDLDISINNESVTIRGKREKETKIKDEDYFYQECYWGRFSRTIILPQEIDPEKSTAVLKNGILTIHLPKLNRQKSKKIKVRFD